jgi:eukaryotic-like serine/threonine-protein kinase
MDLTPFHGPPATVPRVPGFVARTLLGFGTHGEVWLADDLTTGDRVALKIGRQVSSVSAGAPVSEAMDRETALLCRIEHPHIVRFRRVVPLADGSLAMVLDLAAGGSLASLVAARGQLDPGEVSTLLVPLAAALDHLHRRGVVHGDLAPGNVLFAADGRPQLGDLGVARVLGTRTEVAWATPGFTDPAISCPTEGEVDLRAADLWGLAAIGWFALTGRPPEPVPAGGAPTDQAESVGASALRELLIECLAELPAQRPSLNELSDRAWRAARPLPVRLVSPQASIDDAAGLPPLSARVTRPVVVARANVGDVDRGDADRGSPGQAVGQGRAGAALESQAFGADRGAADPNRATVGVGSSRVADATAAAGKRGSLGGGWLRGRATAGAGGRAAVLAPSGAAVVAVGAVAALGVAAGVRAAAFGDDDARSDSVNGVSADQVSPVAGSVGGTPSPAASASAGSAVDRRSARSAGASAGLDAELTRALSRIGRARAMAFRRVSADFLAAADVTGSPAYLQDLELVQRLRARGYRLEGVRYDVSQVRVLHRRGELVDVRALVTTSGHRQVRINSGAAVQVPADGPRPVILTVAPVDGNRAGPDRWRIRSVQVAS